MGISFVFIEVAISIILDFTKATQDAAVVEEDIKRFVTYINF